VNNPGRGIAALSSIAFAAAVLLSGCGAAETAATTPPPALTVTLVQPRQEQWPQIVHANGAIAAWQEAVIGAETGSLRIVEVLADVGDRVRRGQLLARLADDTVKADIGKSEAALAEARAGLEQAEANLRRSEVVADSGALSSLQLDQYRTAAQTAQASLDSAQAQLDSGRIRLRQTRIVAVDDGVISARSALLGNVVSAGAELFRLVRQERIEWQAEVDARQLAQIRPDQIARLTLPDGRSVEGRVRLASPTLSLQTGRAIVFVQLPAGSGAQPGMYASGTIEQAATPALTLPESSLVLRDGRSDVYLFNADGNTVTRKRVETGRRREGRVEILSGLESGAHVVASGGAFLADGATVQPAQRSTEDISP